MTLTPSDIAVRIRQLCDQHAPLELRCGLLDVVYHSNPFRDRFTLRVGYRARGGGAELHVYCHLPVHVIAELGVRQEEVMLNAWVRATFAGLAQLYNEKYSA